MDPIDPKAAAMIIQDLQNDVIIEGGAFADSGAPAHATSQNVVENVKGLAAAARKAGVPVQSIYIPGVDHSFIGATPEATRDATLRATNATFDFFHDTLGVPRK